MDNNSDELIEKVIELGLGLSIMKQIPDIISLNDKADSKSQNEKFVNTKSGSQTFVVINKSQSGPYAEDELLLLIKNNLLLPETLVWRTGMNNWAQASTVSDISKLFILAKIK